MKPETAAFALLALIMPVGVQAQAYRCVPPRMVPTPVADLPTREQPRRLLPIGGYTLAVTWAPGFCRAHRGDPSAQFECMGTANFGFSLHGLWPDGEGPEWPQYCRAAEILPTAIIRGQLCATPSVQLIQHEWAKHGTCTGESAAAYFAAGRSLYARLQFPDMAALSRRENLTVAMLARAVAGANRGVRADMMRITTTRSGWLDEIWFCLDTQRRFRSCPAHQGGAPGDAPVRIWRGGRLPR